ncbi:hypothetical protein N0B44_17210 [Roseibacterium beibuensis]|uniref:hypothetical protein n=1 Tax=[Roseibacterium] beibuensis TaxID=1193142 RepID=UPI00217EB1CF|nr:hypothetical protein [Roseibacterium beibuensis]MCS6624658.1 hypothetical protein [Roseibacterium beibuensis]
MPHPELHKYLGEAYERTKRVAHRRRATLIAPPAVSLFVCLTRPAEWKTTFPDFLRAILERLNDAALDSPQHSLNAQKIESFVESTVRHYDVSRTAPEPRESGGLTLELQDKLWEHAVWRIEIHRDDVHLTLHAGLRIERKRRKGLVVCLLGRKGDARRGIVRQADTEFVCPWRRSQADTLMAEGLRSVLFEKLVEELENRFNPVMQAVEPIYHRTEVVSSPDDLKDKVFALLYGVIVPWTLIRDADPGPRAGAGRKAGKAKPCFPDFDEPELAKHAIPDAQQRTNRFLTRYWDVLNGSLIANNSDCVACYMQGGHSIYVSSLGSQQNATKDPQKYLLLYEDPGQVRKRGGPSTGVPAPYNFAWRLSRFVSRIHDIGAARLKALQQHEEIARFLLQAREIEFMLAERNLRLDSRELKLVEHQFFQITHADTVDVPHGRKLEHQPPIGKVRYAPGTTPLKVRAATVRYQYALMMRLAGDLGIIPLPTYQSYDHFLRRRVVGLMERLSGASDRFDSIVRALDSANIRNQSSEIVRIQRIADVVGALVFTFYTFEFAKHLAHATAQDLILGPWRLHGDEIAMVAAAIAGLFVLRHTGHTLWYFVVSSQISLATASSHWVERQVRAFLNRPRRKIGGADIKP